MPAKINLNHAVAVYPSHKSGWYWLECVEPVTGRSYGCYVSPSRRLVDQFKPFIRFVGQIGVSQMEALVNDYVADRDSVTEAANPKKESTVSEVNGYVFSKPSIPMEALTQDTHWFDKNGVEYKITDMDPSHAYYASQKLKKAFGQFGTSSKLFKALTKQSKGHYAGRKRG